MAMDELLNQLIRHEGMRLKPYKDTVGKTTIGVGRNLDDVGITEEEAMMLLKRDMQVARTELLSTYPAFNFLSDERLHAFTNMVFNMGINRFGGFKNMIAAVVVHDYSEAAKQMLDSRWAKQVGRRAIELSEQVRTDEYQVG